MSSTVPVSSEILLVSVHVIESSTVAVSDMLRNSSISKSSCELMSRKLILSSIDAIQSCLSDKNVEEIHQ